MPAPYTGLRADFEPLDLLPVEHLNSLSSWAERAAFGLSLVTHDDSAAPALSEEEDRPGLLLVYGALTAARHLLLRSEPGARWWLGNATGGGFELTFRTAQGSGIQLPAGWGAPAWCDGSDILPLGPPVALSGFRLLLPAGMLLADGSDLELGAGSGTRIGTAAGQRLGFYGAAPVPRPAALTPPDAALLDASWDAAEQGVVENLRTRVNQLESRLQSLGLLG